MFEGKIWGGFQEQPELLCCFVFYVVRHSDWPRLRQCVFGFLFGFTVRKVLVTVILLVTGEEMKIWTYYSHFKGR
jgi:hypothetical protein